MSNQINASSLYISDVNWAESSPKYICLMKCFVGEMNQSYTIAVSGYSSLGDVPSLAAVTFSPRSYLNINTFAKIIGGSGQLFLGYKQIDSSSSELWIKIPSSTQLAMRPICYTPSGVTFFPNGTSLLATEPSGIVWNKAEVS